MRLVAALVAVTGSRARRRRLERGDAVFRYGVAAGEITSTGNSLDARPASGNTRLVVRLGSQVVAARVLQASAASDLTVQSP